MQLGLWLLFGAWCKVSHGTYYMLEQHSMHFWAGHTLGEELHEWEAGKAIGVFTAKDPNSRCSMLCKFARIATRDRLRH